jgi:hypothetical protein
LPGNLNWPPWTALETRFLNLPQLWPCQISAL